MIGRADYADDLGSLQFADVRDYYRAPGHDPTTLIRHLLERVRSQADANVWISVADDDTLLAAAAQLTQRWPDPATRPPLWGIPIAVKDNVDVAGLPTTAGCPDFGYHPADSAALVDRLLDAGALIVGKTNMDQFASGLTGARSAYGICRSPFDPDYISGGSSSGSALAVSLGLASAAIGTDTAGSGRVPAAFTNTVGLKPSRGLVSTCGVVPACRSLDCASVFALSVADASAVLAAIAGPDSADPYSRGLPIPPARPNVALAATGQRIGYCEFEAGALSGPAAAAYQQALDTAAELGAELVLVPFSPFGAAGDLLYDGPWVAERLTNLESWIDEHPDSLLPVTATVLGNARSKSAIAAFRGFHRLAELSAQVARVWDGVDALILPTVPLTPTVADTLADPHGMNTRMGRYTMFGNLLDLAGLALPVTFDPTSGLPAGVGLYGPAGSDGQLIAIGAQLERELALPAGATPFPVRPVVHSSTETQTDELLLAVVGAHRTGYPLNGMLRELGATSVNVTLTAPNYRLYALPTSPSDPISRPGLIRVEALGAHIEVELFAIEAAALGRLLVTIPAPLGLGVVELVDGRSVIGFLCEAFAGPTARDITEFKSWPNYVASR